MKRNTGCVRETRDSGKYWLGITGAICSAVIYGVNPLLVKSAYQCGSSVAAYMLYPTLLAVILLVLFMRLFRIPLLPEKKRLASIAVTGFFSTVTTFLLFLSYQYVATGIATTMHFTYPTFVAAGSVFVLKKKISGEKKAALLLSLSGVCIAADFAGSTSLTGIALALTSGMTYAAYILCMEKTGLKDMNYMQLCLYMCAIRLTVMFFYGTCTGGLQIPADGRLWLLIFAGALFVSIGAVVLFQLGVRYAGGTSTAVFSMFEPITSIIVGVFVMRETMTIQKGIGCFLILLGIVLTVREGKRPLIYHGKAPGFVLIAKNAREKTV